ncbi:probable E3 ubiquitin-protein ligase RHG1A isoform X2 [Arachis ipaensis]|uniref:probable E3 ubiquitin-protein ligase RHG1A isoform X2 n=1 Tax=Arachis ipaensis TaxID=130454 RepID=UPI000A2B152B|nr:probable E3 ubiquitin-protein ligase RHG1A isoform X2 [Arachis ipaensis]
MPSNNRDRPDSNVMSVRTRRPTNGDHNAPGVLHLTSLEAPLSRPVSYNRPGSSSDELYGIMPMSPTEYGITHSLINRDNFRRRYNMDGIAEVLLALERIEQDVELTHEQILLLESNLLLTGLNFYDQHRDMRLDIDNMSYEELLALEERMGSVSTALTEEALSECLKRSFFKSLPSDDVTETFNGNKNKDDTKCSICQEEYVVGDEVGNLQCQHMFHVVCIQQWLRLKNWCPICKASVAKSSTPPSPPPSSSSPSSY